MTDAERIKVILNIVSNCALKRPSFEEDDTDRGVAYDIGLKDGMIIMASIIFKFINDTQETQ